MTIMFFGILCSLESANWTYYQQFDTFTFRQALHSLIRLMIQTYLIRFFVLHI